MQYVYDGTTGLAGGLSFGAALTALAAEQRVDLADLAAACGWNAAELDAVLRGDREISVAAMARLARGLRLRPIEFMQKAGLLSLEVYAFGLDPLFFLPDGPIRHDARIYMREINPRHAVPENDMTKRNPALKAIAEDPLLDSVAKLELELTYLLALAVAATGGRL
jgi:transcriptional regulator with XRE-family HTH domain